MIKPTALGWSIFYALFVAAAVPIIGAARHAETDYQNPDTASSQGTYQKPVQNPWRKTKATNNNSLWNYQHLKSHDSGQRSKSNRQEVAGTGTAGDSKLMDRNGTARSTLTVKTMEPTVLHFCCTTGSSQSPLAKYAIGAITQGVATHCTCTMGRHPTTLLTDSDMAQRSIGHIQTQNSRLMMCCTSDVPTKMVLGSRSWLANSTSVFTPLKQSSPVETGSGWKKTKSSFYGNPYDSHPSRYRTADGTPYKSDGNFCATRLVPLGTVIEVRRGKVSLHLVVRDTQAKRYGHLIDIPSKTWDKFGAKRSIGMLPVEWRVVK